MTTRKFDAGILGRLADATAEELSAALTAIREDYQAYQEQPTTQATLAAVQELHAAATAIRAETDARPERAAQLQTAFADLDALTDREAPHQEESTEAQERVEDTHGQEPEEQPEAEGETAADDGAAVTAAGTRPAARRLGTIAPNRTERRAATRTLPRVMLRTTAAAGLRDFNPGQDMTREDLMRAFYTKVTAMGNVPGNERYTVATARSVFPESRYLRAGNGEMANMALVEAAVDEVQGRHALANAAEQVTLRSGPDGAHALVAAGLCGPLETLYDIRVVGDTDRPVRDALLRFGADRGGIQYRPAIDGVTQTGGIGNWTEAQDEADPIVPKTCVEIDCPGVVTASVEATYQCLTHSNMSTRFDPEFYDSVVRAQGIAHARFAENKLLTTMTTASKDVYSAQVLGATRDILATMDHMTAYLRNVRRLSNAQPLRWIAPLWTLNLMRADITRQMVGDGLQALAITDAMIASWLAERNINATFHLDGINPADLTVPTPDVVVPAQFYTVLADESAVPGFPDAISSLLFPEGDWLHLDGGTLDLGVVRDSTLNGQNRFQTFSESWEFPAFRGVETIHLVIQVQPTGASAATVSTAAVTD